MRSLALLLCGFALGTMLVSVRAQDAPTPEPQAHGQQHDLTLTEVLDILSTYDVRHSELVGWMPPRLYGVTSYDDNQPTIWIFNRGDLRSRTSTVIHELTHIHYRNHGVSVPEEFVDAEEERQWQKFYGAAQ